MKFRIEDDQVPAGTYEAEFVGAKPVRNKFGEGAVFGFRILSGEFSGQIVTRTSAGKATPRNPTGQMLAALAGVQPQAGLEIDEKEYRGNQYSIEVGRAPEGTGSRVERIVRER